MNKLITHRTATYKNTQRDCSKIEKREAHYQNQHIALKLIDRMLVIKIDEKQQNTFMLTISFE